MIHHVYFLVISIVTLLIGIICTMINNFRFHIIKNLLIYLPQTVKKKLMLNGEPNKAREISLTVIPKLEIWYSECQNYGLINIFGLLSAGALIVSGAVYHAVSYIIVLLSAMFLASNLLFLPRTLRRLNEVIDINNGYVFLMIAFQQANATQSQENKNDTGSASSS